MFFFDIDQFKLINDTLGHDIGDKILLKIIKRLKKALPEDYFFARFGGDEFIIIVNKASQTELENIAELIMAQFIEPFKVEKYLLDMSASMGICQFPDMFSSYQKLLKQADIAMYNAKASGRSNYNPNC